MVKGYSFPDPNIFSTKMTRSALSLFVLLCVFSAGTVEAQICNETEASVCDVSCQLSVPVCDPKCSAELFLSVVFVRF